jgi:hypothetical protein
MGMTRKRLHELVGLEGRQVGISLTDGSRIDDCQLVFAGNDRVWVFVNGQDEWLSSSAVCDFWESN